MRSLRAIWLLCGLTVVLLLGVLLWVASGRPHRVTRANFDKIQKGMTVAEVEALLGRENLHETSELAHGVLAVWRIHEYAEDDNFWLIPSDKIVIQFSGFVYEELPVTNKRLWSPSAQDVWQHVRNRIMKALSW